MAKNTSIIGILINIQKAGNGDKEAIGALKNLQSNISQATAIFGTLTAAAYTLSKAFDATGGLFVNYANDVRGLQQAFGLTSEEASRLIQLTDDLGISQDALTKSLKAMSSNGIQPSLAGLQALSEKFNTIQDPAAQAKFLVDNFGKSGLEMAAAMRMGAGGLQTMNDAVEESLVLTQQAVNEARAYEMQVDALSDSWTAFKMTIGQQVVPALNDMLIHMQAQNTVGKEFQEQGKLASMVSREFADAVAAEVEALKAKQAAQIAAENGANNLLETDLALIAAEKELAIIQAALAAGLRGEYSSAYDTYEEKVAKAKEQIAQAKAEMAALAAAGKLTADKQAELNQRIEEGNAALREASALLAETTAQMIYQQAAAGLDARSSLKLARALGLISEADYAIAEAIEELKARRDEEIKLTGDAEAANEKYIQGVERLKNLVAGLPPETVVKVVTQFITTGEPTTTTGDTGGTGTAPPPDGCFLAGTQIETPEGPRNIENIRVGDIIVSMATENGECITVRVARVFHHPAESNRGYLVINKFLKVTSNHPIYTSTGYKEAGELKIGEPMRAWNGWTFVYSIERVDVPVATFNIQTDHVTHNYFADGILVHNKTSEGGVVSGPESGYWHSLHGTEYVFNQSQFGDMVRAFSNIASGASMGGGGGGTQISGNVYVTYSGNDFEGLMQSIQSAARRV